MPRPATLFTGQWADLPLRELAPLAAAWGYDGLELACWGDHFDVVRALAEPGYAGEVRALLDSHGLAVHAISNHLVGQAVCDRIDARHQAVLSPEVWGDGDPDGVSARAAERMRDTARAAALLGVQVVNGFTGSAIWPLLYSFPPNLPGTIDVGYAQFAERWTPILDAFAAEGVRFALEPHPTEIAYDFVTAERALAALGGHRAFGFNLDPSHFVHQGLDPAAFADEFDGRILHVHVKDVRLRPNGRRSVLGSHLEWGDERRGWDFCSPGRGDVDFDDLIRALNRIGYTGPLSVEWEDPTMDRVHGAREARELVRRIDFPPAGGAFDAAYGDQPPS